MTNLLRRLQEDALAKVQAKPDSFVFPSQQPAPPKTKNGIRRVPLTPDMVGFLRKLKLASKFSQETDFVFTTTVDRCRIATSRCVAGGALVTRPGCRRR
jgi:hypothetical protein